MELQLAVQSGGRSNVPNYLRPPAASCHHACKYVEDKDDATHQPNNKPPRKKQPLIRLRRQLFGDRKVQKAAATDDGKNKYESVDVKWKDIAAYGTAPADYHEGKKAAKGKKPHGAATTTQNEPRDEKPAARSSKVTTRTSKSSSTGDAGGKTVRPPRGTKKPANTLAVQTKHPIDQELVDGYQPLSPSLLQTCADLLRDLEQEMVHERSTNTTEELSNPTCSLDDEDLAAARSRPVPAHRRAKSTSLSGSRSVRFPLIARQPSRNNTSSSATATFKLRSRSSRGPAVLPSDYDGEEEDEKRPATARLLARSTTRRGSAGGADEIGGAGGRGIQLRIRSLRRRGVGGAGGFVVPAVALRHHKTLEKKRSQRLYNSVIEETAGRLAGTRKSRVKALVGAFESVIAKIAK